MLRLIAQKLFVYSFYPLIILCDFCRNRAVSVRSFLVHTFLTAPRVLHFASMHEERTYYSESDQTFSN
jgi:hypothetical protein